MSHACKDCDEYFTEVQRLQTMLNSALNYDKQVIDLLKAKLKISEAEKANLHKEISLLRTRILSLEYQVDNRKDY